MIRIVPRRVLVQKFQDGVYVLGFLELREEEVLFSEPFEEVERRHDAARLIAALTVACDLMPSADAISGSDHRITCRRA